MFYFNFAVSGVYTNILYPPLIMFIISFFSASAGISGALILVPFQMSFFGYTAPGVTATNFIYSIVTSPFQTLNYIKNRNFSLSVFFLFLTGSIPGIFFGYCIRIFFLFNEDIFKVFTGIFLCFFGFISLRKSKKIKDEYNIDDLKKPDLKKV